LLWACVHSRSCGVKDPSACEKSVVVETHNGPIQGFDRDVEGQTVSTFWALPFAEPPVGARRFHYPEPYKNSWTEVRAAITPNDACPQGKGTGAGNEDCLYLNVYAPSKVVGSNATLPVMFWIYGGGFRIGDANMKLGGEMLYDGARLAGRHDVVVVTTNYRLNALGFNTYTKGENGQTGTQAMEDQRLAMKWTHDNIQGFGGDPTQVTLFGESAGAFSIMYHLVSPPSWPYFSKAISESGVSRLSWFFQPKDDATTLFEDWAEAVGCIAGESQLACLQERPAQDFCTPPANFTGGLSPAFPTFPVGPVIDGTEHGLLAMPGDLIKAGRFAEVPLIVGANKDGGSIFEPMVDQLVPGVHGEASSQADVDKILDWAFTPEDHAKILDVYHPDDYRTLRPGIGNRYQKLISRAMRDLGFACSDRLVASSWKAKGLDAYMYVFSFDAGELDKFLPLGDFHAMDVAFVWRALLWVPEVLPLSGAVQRMADIMTCQWASFAYTGNPNGGAISIPNCDHVHKTVNPWPVFDTERNYYSLKAGHEPGRKGGPQIVPLRADNKYPDDEFPSDVQCDMWDTVTFPWHTKLEVMDILV